MSERGERSRPASTRAESTENRGIQIDPDLQQGDSDGSGAFLRAFRILFPRWFAAPEA
ncbi:hypothetical protein M2317_001851 [Microbacterium sp. ZKA21]|jgi:hypothetical protein|uniref:hypothetical protein n=1 Tax=Microbacterium sp. ZKA21 TaxID=3381694 RepID=UPI003D22E720